MAARMGTARSAIWTVPCFGKVVNLLSGNFVDGWKTQGIMTFHNKTVYFGTFSSELFNG
jgi:hypothetical protein